MIDMMGDDDDDMLSSILAKKAARSQEEVIRDEDGDLSTVKGFAVRTKKIIEEVREGRHDRKQAAE